MALKIRMSAAASVAHGHGVVEPPPDALDVPRVAVEDLPGIILERADLAPVERVGLARPDDPLVRVQPDPAELGGIGAAGTAADTNTLPEGHTVNPGDLQRLKVVDGGLHRCGQQGTRPESKLHQERPSSHRRRCHRDPFRFRIKHSQAGPLAQLPDVPGSDDGRP